jgi:hypothetical protein
MASLLARGVLLLRWEPRVDVRQDVIRDLPVALASPTPVPQFGYRNGYWHGEPGMRRATHGRASAEA